ncbi:MAG: NAD(P)-binding protein, partial [Thermoplasmata archaeon]|nr:NAD(P)-binding protein [Thermoplasmata archaeon]
MKVAIVGAGLGGLATAAKLVEKHIVDIYEKENVLGGRALTMEGIDEDYLKLIAKFEMANAFAHPSLDEIYGGEYKIDLGFHLIGGGKRGACVKALKELNASVNFIGSRLGYIGDRIEYPMLSSLDKIKMLPRIIQLMTSRKKTIEEMKKMSMEETIEKYGRGKLKT